MPKKDKSKKIFDEMQKEEQRRIQAEKERVRSQLAFSTIFSTMLDIAREEVCHAAIEGWRKCLNAGRARGQSIKVADFLALSEAADPFNADAPANRAWGEWFAHQWKTFQPNAPSVHVRGLHYLVSRDEGTPHAIRMPNGEIYTNTHARWKDLERAGKYARYLGLIPVDKFLDKRSRDPIVKDFSKGWRDLFISHYGSHSFEDFDLPSFPDFPDFPVLWRFPQLPLYDLSFRGQQRYRIELWIEKSTQQDMLTAICERYRVTFVEGQGEISISAMWRALERAERWGPNVETIILYISDFDPAGRGMPVAASRKLEKLRVMRRSNAKIRLYPIALTYEQCVEYRLPRAPFKKMDERKQRFLYQFGEGTTEFDSLESLYPDALGKIVEQAILRFIDPSVHKRVEAKREEIARDLRAIQYAIHVKYKMDELRGEYKEADQQLDRIMELHDGYEQRYEELKEEYDDEVRCLFDKWKENYLDPLSSKISRIMRNAASDLREQMPDIYSYEMPQAYEVPLADDCLYDSPRDYVPQLASYKQFAGKFSHLVEDDEDEDDDEIA